MGYKSRSNWNLSFCIKNCSNKYQKCNECVGFENYIKRLNEEIDVQLQTVQAERQTDSLFRATE